MRIKTRRRVPMSQRYPQTLRQSRLQASYDDARQVVIADVLCQPCGGGRRVIKKRIGNL